MSFARFCEVGGEHSDLAHHDPTPEPAVEATSTHGSFEWFLHRHRLGFVGGSDSHTATAATAACRTKRCPQT